jgi:uncharacterized membrane protein YdbT with pleckstrin-like domain
MAFIDELLSGDEQVLVYEQQHWIALASRLVTRLISVMVLVFIMVGIQSVRFRSLINNLPGGETSQIFQVIEPAIRYVQIGCLILLVLVVISALFDYLAWNARAFVLTSRRVIGVSGVVNKRSMDSSLERINDIQLSQSWLGRLLNYGDLLILTASEQGHNNLEKITDPLEFKRQMQEARHTRDTDRARPATPQVPAAQVAAPAPAPVPAPKQWTDQDITQSLARLSQLRTQGLITDEEFQQKKREILNRL